MSKSTSTRRKLRLTTLFAILVLMLVGLWYDRNVVRPSVEAAWNSISELNTRINSAAEATAMTNADVQKALNRQPSRTMTQGPFQVEVYSWMAGLPFRTRDYYAVYSPGMGKLFFTTHFKFAIPKGELVMPTARFDPSQTVPDSADAYSKEVSLAGPNRVGSENGSCSGCDSASRGREQGGINPRRGKRGKERERIKPAERTAGIRRSTRSIARILGHPGLSI